MPVKHYKIRFEQWVPVPVEKTFAFFANPYNLPKLMPPWMETRVESTTYASRQITAVGGEIVFSYRIVPGFSFRQHWTAKVVEFESLHHFCDEQVSGPFAYWQHCHQITREDWDGRSGSRIVDEIKYTMGYGIIGKLVDRLLIRPQLKANFDPRQEAIARLLVGG